MSGKLSEEGAGVAKAVISGFGGSPALLLIVVLNLCAMVAAVYYLVNLDRTRQNFVSEMTQLLQACITQRYEERQNGARPPASR